MSAWTDIRDEGSIGKAWRDVSPFASIVLRSSGPSWLYCMKSFKESEGLAKTEWLLGTVRGSAASLGQPELSFAVADIARLVNLVCMCRLLPQVKAESERLCCEGSLPGLSRFSYSKLGHDSKSPAPKRSKLRGTLISACSIIQL